jgi:hypothetical protein
MQEREPEQWATTELDRLLARDDEAAHDWLARQLLAAAPIDPTDAPAASVADEVRWSISG